MGISRAGLTVGVGERYNAREILWFCPFIRLDGIWYVKYPVMNDMKLFCVCLAYDLSYPVDRFGFDLLEKEWLP